MRTQSQLTELPCPFDDAESVRAIRRKIRNWGNKHYQHFPWRSTTSPYLGLIAEVLLQRTKASSAVVVYHRFAERFSKSSQLADASISEIENVIHSLGLKWRAPLLRRLGTELEALIEIPTDLESLTQLPGVGQYAGSAWLSFHGRVRAVLIDANTVRLVSRVSGRSFDGETRRQPWVFGVLDALTPPRAHRQFNFAILDLSMLLCKPRLPECGHCPLSDNCKYFMSTGVGS